MGYYTRYTIRVHGGSLPGAPLPWDMTDLADLLNQRLDGYRFEALPDEVRSEEPRKWYDYADDLRWLAKQVSEKGGDAVLAAYGEGEEAGDLWVHYFRPDGSDSGQLKAGIEFPAG